MFGQILGPDGIIVIVIVAAVLLFGGKKLPELARGLGSAAHEFKKGTDEGDHVTAEGPAPGVTDVEPESELRR